MASSARRRPRHQRWPRQRRTQTASGEARGRGAGPVCASWAARPLGAGSSPRARSQTSCAYLVLTLSLAGLPRMAGSAECRDRGAWAPGRPRQQGHQHPRGVRVLLLTLRGARQGLRGEVVLNATESQLRRGEGREGSGDGWQGWFHSGVNARHLTT